MNRDETFDFVRSGIVAAGGDPGAIFTEDALKAIYNATDGVPRLINQLADHALMMAALGEQRVIDGSGVEEAWADLQQLPIAWNEPPTLSQESGETDAEDMIEFGSLDDAYEVGNDSASVTGDFDGEFEVASASEPASATNEGPPATIARQDDTVAETADSLEPDADPTDRIDEIQRHFDEIEREPKLARSERQPTAELPHPEIEATPVQSRTRSGTEVELVVHGPPNPFAEPFEHEEPVTNRQIPLDEFGSGTTVSVRILRDDNESIGGANGSFPEEQAIDRPPKLSIAHDVDAEPDVVKPEEPTEAPQAVKKQDSAAEDPVLPDQQMPAEVARLVSEAKSLGPPMEKNAGGDRDLLEIEEEEPRIKVQQPRGARRKSYRKIFTTLRKLQA